MTESKWTSDGLFSSEKYDWETPQPLFDRLNEEFNFTLDAAASKENSKCKRWLEKPAGLVQPWHTHAPKGSAIWVNPPYGRGINEWMMKCAKEGLSATVVALVFARTDTRWFHDWVAPFALEVRFIKGRVKFRRGEKVGPAPAPSMVVVWGPHRVPRLRAVSTMGWWAK
jgi:phage N-6-adenine-methyltransferase